MISIKLEKKEAVPVMSIRTKTSMDNLSAVMGKSFGAVAAYLAENGQAPAGVPFAAYYNLDMNDLDVEIGFPVSQKLPGRGEIQPGEIPGGEQVSCFYKGSYDNMKIPYDAMAKWLDENGYKATGTSYEFYLNDPGEVKPEDLETIIMFPVVKA
jgi:effector-binding domain-containing protein